MIRKMPAVTSPRQCLPWRGKGVGGGAMRVGAEHGGGGSGMGCKECNVSWH